MAYKILFPGMQPGALQVAKISLGKNASDNPDIVWPATDISIGTILFKAPAGVFITNVRAHIRTAFGSTGAFTMNVGDGTDPDAYLESTDLVASDVGFRSMVAQEFGSTGAASRAAMLHGKVSSTSNTVDTDLLETVVAVTIGTAPINAGFADFYVEYFSQNGV